MEVSLNNSKIKFVQTWCVFESQKPQVVFDGLGNQAMTIHILKYNLCRW